MLYIAVGYLVLFIIRPFENWEFLGRIRIEKIYGILMLGALLVSHRKLRLGCAQTLAVLGLFGAIGMSAVFAYRPELAWPQLYKYATLVAFYFVFMATVKDEGQLQRFVLAYVCTMAVYQLLTLREYLFFGRGVWAGGMWRMRGFDDTFGHPNAVAASIACSMPFVFGFLRQDSRLRVRLAVAGYTALSIACITRTGSRSGLLGFLLVCSLYILSLKGRRRVYAATAFSLFLLIAWLQLPAEQQLRFRVLTQPVGEYKGSDKSRISGKGFSMGLEMLRDRPLLGVGVGCFASYSDEQLGETYVFSHNLYGELLGNIGALGTLAFACMIAIAFKNLLLVRKDVRRGNVSESSPIAWVAWAVGVMFLALLFMGWASHSLYRYNWLWGAAMAALARDFAVRKKQGGESNSQRGGRQVGVSLARSNIEQS